jgi:molybdate transport system ATP-binding protein
MPALSVRLRQAAPIPLDAALECEAGELLALVGPSGSGKTTILRMISGLARCGDGRVTVGSEVWFDAQAGIAVPPQQRRVGLVFQNYALFPHLSALDNVAIASSRADPAAHARDVLARVRLDGLVDRRPAQLSGGQQQRVALARALAREPEVLLLDEPFSAVDQATRHSLYLELAELHRGLEIPIVLVTHDLQEAQRLADRMVVLDRGRALAAGTVDDVLALPSVAGLMPGLDAGSLLHCRVGGHDERYGLTLLEVDGGCVLRVPRVEVPVGTPVRVRIPARDVALALSSPVDVSTVNRLPGEVVALQPLDATHVDAQVRIGAAVRLRARLTRESADRLALRPGLAVWCLIKSVALDRATLMMTVERGSRPPTAGEATRTGTASSIDAGSSGAG